MSEYATLIGKTIKDIYEYTNSPGIVIVFTDGTIVTFKSGVYGGFHVQID